MIAFIVDFLVTLAGCTVCFILGIRYARREYYEMFKYCKRLKLKDIPDEEILAFIMAFVGEMERRKKLHERGEMQEEKKPFEEFNGKE